MCKCSSLFLTLICTSEHVDVLPHGTMTSDVILDVRSVTQAYVTKLDISLRSMMQRAMSRCSMPTHGQAVRPVCTVLGLEVPDQSHLAWDLLATFDRTPATTRGINISYA